ncbi:MFS transporter [Vitiosangium sp. GDMCC 1.1324]|uniref:MFS transporter n=1 Tax=Vitiosangium sp. (strain GDMCC 1.1324) TaxID=2138576 RepID=UPI000D399F9D|nr:MFS transporter [Vitiosangium sp. GDMCC 1.1324]PTL79147.1 MFS transporter [Vitiosangium sp. GDMCC 1.1324]
MSGTSTAYERPKRWAVLGAYTLVVGVSQMLWLNFGPLLSLVQTRYGVGEFLAGSLIFVFPLLYVFFSIPAGTLTDTRGYRFTVGLGALGMALFASLRIFDHSFWFLFAGQVGIAIAQPYVVNGISKLVADWFSEEQGAIATGLGTVGMFLGMAVGMAATPALEAAVGLRATMAVFAAVTGVSAVLFLLVVFPNDAVRATGADEPVQESGRGLLRSSPLRVLLLLSFLGLGVFNGLTTWLEQILAPRGIGAEQAGLVGGALIIGGIVGAVVVPALSDWVKRRKPFLILCTAAALLTLYPLCTQESFDTLLLLGGLHGFAFMPAYALLLEMSAQIAGARSAGAATSLLMLAGNAGGVVVVVVMPLVKAQEHDFQRAVVLMMGLLLATLLLAFRAPETAMQALASPAAGERAA